MPESPLAHLGETDSNKFLPVNLTLQDTGHFFMYEFFCPLNLNLQFSLKKKLYTSFLDFPDVAAAPQKSA